MLNKIFQVRINNSWKVSGVKWDVYNDWGGNRYYFVNETNSKEIQNIFKLILKSSQNIPNKGDIIYASKASEIPRFKLKEYIKDKGLKKTSRYNYSNYIIVNKGYLMDLINIFIFNDYRFVNKDFVNSNIQEWTKDRPSISKIIAEKGVDRNLVAMIDTYTFKNTYKNLSLSPAEIQKYEDNTYQVKGTFIDLYRNDRLKNLLTIFYELKNDIKSGKIKIIFDEDLFIELNKEGIELDEEYLKTLREMLFSKDTANIKLGFEMMSNLVMNQPTILSLSFLLNELIHTSVFRPSYYTNSNTNLKSLFKLLRTKGIYWERDWKTFGIGLRNNFKVGKEGSIVKKFLLDNINREFKISNPTAESLVDIVFTTEAQ